MGVVPVDRHYYLDAMAAFREHFAKGPFTYDVRVRKIFRFFDLNLPVLSSAFWLPPFLINFGHHIWMVPKSAVHVVFVFVSDDMKWGEEQLANAGEKKRDLYFAGNGDGVDPDNIGRDLALLAACNHTIQGFRPDIMSDIQIVEGFFLFSTTNLTQGPGTFKQYSMNALHGPTWPIFKANAM